MPSLLTQGRRAIDQTLHRGPDRFSKCASGPAVSLRDGRSAGPEHRTISTNLVALYKALGGGWDLQEVEQNETLTDEGTIP